MSTADQRIDAWEDWKASPWGRIRFALIGDALDMAVAAFGDRPLSILDVGGADGFETLPYAVRGHFVTVADPAAGFFDRGRAEAERLGVADRVRWEALGLEDLPMAGDTAYDVVVCHFVLQYRPAGTLGADVAALAQVTAVGGAISIACPNEPGWFCELSPARDRLRPGPNWVGRRNTATPSGTTHRRWPGNR